MIDVARILVAPLVWLACFSAVYGLHGVLCASAMDGAGAAGLPSARVLLAVAWLAATLVQAGLLAALHFGPFASRSRFVGTVSRATGWTGFVATLWTLFPTVATSHCG